jgi:hypothetical protein
VPAAAGGAALKSPSTSHFHADFIVIMLLLPLSRFYIALLRGVSGEIREKALEALPPASMYMGRTQLSLADIRRYNSAQGSLMYTLHDNDCR